MLRYWTAGESHGKTLVALVDGFPAGVAIDTARIDAELQRRQGGYGRGGRQRIEADCVELLTGVWKGLSLGSPIALQVVNRDYKLERMEDLTRPRPGHGDLAGAVKFLGPIRSVLERASARETTVRVAAGALARQLLERFGIRAMGYVVELGGIRVDPPDCAWDERLARRAESVIYSLDPRRDAEITALIDATGKAGDTLGGVVEVCVEGLPIGLGTHAQWDQKLDGRVAQAVMAVQAIKGVEIGPAFENARLPGTVVHDQLYPGSPHPRRAHNRAGGLEGGMSNGEPIVARIAMKPIPTTVHALDTVDLTTGEPVATQYQRSDVCAVPAAAVVAEAMLAWVLADALLESYGGDRVDALVRRVVDGR